MVRHEKLFAAQQEIQSGDLLDLVRRVEVVDEIDDLHAVRLLINSNRLQVVVGECEEDRQIDLKKGSG